MARRLDHGDVDLLVQQAVEQVAVEAIQHIKRNVRESCAEAPHQGRAHRQGMGVLNPHAEGTGNVLGEARHLPPGDVEHIFHLARTLHQPLAGSRRPHSLRGALQQHDAEFLFELLHVAAKRGLRDPELGRCLGKGPELDHGAKVSQLLDAHESPFLFCQTVQPAAA
jgi:hypothetical protein